ncbi:MAG: ribbon-helix-helix domain-containing protein [Acidithiobacillus sp.]
MNTVRWNIAVSPDVDQSVRMFIAAQGGGRKDDLSRFIEEAVRAYLLERAVEQAKTAAVGMSEAELTDLIDEAVQQRGSIGRTRIVTPVTFCAEAF